MAAVRHLEFWKIVVWSRDLYWHVILHLLTEFRVDRPIVRRESRYSQKTIFNMASVRHLEFEKFRFFLSNVHAQNGNLYLCTKFDRNRIIHDCDMEINLFSKWRPSAILNFRKLQFVMFPVLACDSVFPIQTLR